MRSGPREAVRKRPSPETTQWRCTSARRGSPQLEGEGARVCGQQAPRASRAQSSWARCRTRIASTTWRAVRARPAAAAGPQGHAPDAPCRHAPRGRAGEGGSGESSGDGCAPRAASSLNSPDGGDSARRGARSERAQAAAEKLQRVMEKLQQDMATFKAHEGRL